MGSPGGGRRQVPGLPSTEDDSEGEYGRERRAPRLSLVVVGLRARGEIRRGARGGSRGRERSRPLPRRAHRPLAASGRRARLRVPPAGRSRPPCRRSSSRGGCGRRRQARGALRRVSGRALRRRGRRGGPAAGADCEHAGLAVARPAARRLRGRLERGAGRAAARGRWVRYLAAGGRPGLARRPLRVRRAAHRDVARARRRARCDRRAALRRSARLARVLVPGRSPGRLPRVRRLRGPPGRARPGRAGARPGARRATAASRRATPRPTSPRRPRAGSPSRGRS